MSISQNVINFIDKYIQELCSVQSDNFGVNYLTAFINKDNYSEDEILYISQRAFKECPAFMQPSKSKLLMKALFDQKEYSDKVRSFLLSEVPLLYSDYLSNSLSTEERLSQEFDALAEKLNLGLDLDFKVLERLSKIKSNPSLTQAIYNKALDLRRDGEDVSEDELETYLDKLDKAEKIENSIYHNNNTPLSLLIDLASKSESRFIAFLSSRIKTSNLRSQVGTEEIKTIVGIVVTKKVELNPSSCDGVSYFLDKMSEDTLNKFLGYSKNTRFSAASSENMTDAAANILLSYQEPAPTALLISNDKASDDTKIKAFDVFTSSDKFDSDKYYLQDSLAKCKSPTVVDYAVGNLLEKVGTLVDDINVLKVVRDNPHVSAKTIGSIFSHYKGTPDGSYVASMLAEKSGLPKESVADLAEYAYSRLDKRITEDSPLYKEDDYDSYDTRYSTEGLQILNKLVSQEAFKLPKEYSIKFLDYLSKFDNDTVYNRTELSHPISRLIREGHVTDDLVKKFLSEDSSLPYQLTGLSGNKNLSVEQLKSILNYIKALPHKPLETYDVLRKILRNPSSDASTSANDQQLWIEAHKYLESLSKTEANHLQTIRLVIENESIDSPYFDNLVEKKLEETPQNLAYFKDFHLKPSIKKKVIQHYKEGEPYRVPEDFESADLNSKPLAGKNYGILTFLRSLYEKNGDYSLTWVEFKAKYPKYENVPLIKSLFMAVDKSQGKKSNELSLDYLNLVIEQTSTTQVDPTKFVSFGYWGGMQRYFNDKDNLTVQLNWDPDFVQSLKADKEFFKYFSYLVSSTHSNVHPVHPLIGHTLGWMRVSKIDEKTWLIEEIQSDIESIVQTYLHKINSKDFAGLSETSEFLSEESGLQNPLANDYPKQAEYLERIKVILKDWHKIIMSSILYTARKNGVRDIYMLTPQHKEKNKTNQGKLTRLYVTLPREFNFEEVRKDFGEGESVYWHRRAKRLDRVAKILYAYQKFERHL